MATRVLQVPPFEVPFGHWFSLGSPSQGPNPEDPRKEAKNRGSNPLNLDESSVGPRV